MSKRICVACGDSYEYPARGTLATRRFCDECAALDAPVRRALERIRQQVARLAAELQALKKPLKPPVS